jgi:hypothetical protein
MPLVYNSAGRKLYVLRRISTDTILNPSTVYPNAVDDAPIVGLDPDLEYLAIDKDDVPTYDPRVFDLLTSGAKVANLWRITHTTPKKVAAQIKVAVTNRERTELERHVRNEERDKLLLLGLGVLYLKITGLTLNAKQTAIKDRVVAAATKLWQNDQRVADLFAEIDANTTPNIDTGWADNT